MRRRSIITLLCLAVAVATCALPAMGVAQTTATPASGAPPASTAAPATAVPGASATTPAGSAAPASSTAPGVPAQTPGTSSDDSLAALVLLAAVGVLLLGAVSLWGLARWRAWEPHWLLRWRHATAEAGWRTSAAWAEFRDWIRLGR